MKKLYTLIFLIFGWFTVFSQPPVINVTPDNLTGFLATMDFTNYVATSQTKSYTVSGTNLIGDINIYGGGSGYGVICQTSLTEIPFVPADIHLTPVAGTVSTTTIYVRIRTSYLGNVYDGIPNASNGAVTKTVGVIGDVIMPEPTVPSTLSFGARTNNSIVVNMNGGNGEERILFVKESSPVDIVPQDLQHFYHGNGTFGTTFTYAGNGNYAVFTGPGHSVTVNNLAAGKTYYFALYEVNVAYGAMYPPSPTNYDYTGWNYLLPGDAGNETTAYAPVTYNWVGGSSSWATAANWSPLRTSAATNDILQFSGGNTITVTNVPAQSVGQLIVTSNTNVTLQGAAGSNILTVNGTIAGDDLRVDAGSSLNITGANPYRINVATGNTGVVDGNITFTSGAHKLTAADANAIAFNSGAVFTAGTGFSGNAFGNTTANSIVFKNGSTYQQTAGSDPFALTEPAAVAVFNQGSLFKLQGNITPSVSGRTYGDFELNASGANVNVSGTSLLSIDNLTVTNGALNLGMTTAGMNLKGNTSVAPGASLNFAPASAGTINFAGTTPQTITNAGTLSFSGNQTVNLNNATGVTLNSPVTIAGTINFTSGILNTTSTNLLTMAAGSSATNASNASFVMGPVKKVGNTDFIFPVGKANGLVPIRISNFVGGSAANEFIAEYIRANAALLGTITDPFIHHVSNCEYWTLNLNNGSPTVDVTLYWNANNPCGGAYINDLAQLQIAHFNSTSWNSSSTGFRALSGNTSAGDITWFGVNNFSPFTLGSTSSSNPLPIVINYIKGTKQGTKHLLNWKVTCISTPRVTMVLERSTDSRNFTGINSITADAVRCDQPFDYTDNDPLKGMNYYRLKMTDADGKVSYSSIVALLNAVKGFDIISIAPNPVVDGNFKLNVASAQPGKMNIDIFDMQGRLVNRQSISLIAGFNNAPINVSDLSPGTYTIRGTIADDKSREMRFVKQ